MERQIKGLKGAKPAPQTDQVAIEHAVRVATEREREGWRRRFEQGRARFRRMVAKAASVAESLGQLKESLEEAEREWSNAPAAVGPTNLSANHRAARETSSALDVFASAKNSDGPLKFSSGERRILTALAQYPKRRTKVQVAVLTGYAATGGGFNNYLGGLRSRGLIEGAGEKITITEARMQVLGSWEPLPTGSSLIDYWRSRLGKAERLILETLTEAYPSALSKEEVAAKAGYEVNGGGFNNALGRLRTLELVRGRSELRASDDLYESGAA